MSGDRELLRPRPRRGRYEDEFWSYVAKQDLRLQTCGRCGYQRFPSGPVCPRCMSDDASWVPVSGRATVLSWVVFHRQYFPGIATPHVVVAGQLEEGTILLADLRGNDAAGLAAGTPLQIAYTPARSADDGPDWVVYQWARP